MIPDTKVVASLRKHGIDPKKEKLITNLCSEYFLDPYQNRNMFQTWRTGLEPNCSSSAHTSKTRELEFRHEDLLRSRSNLGYRFCLGSIILMSDSRPIGHVLDLGPEKDPALQTAIRICTITQSWMYLVASFQSLATEAGQFVCVSKFENVLRSLTATTKIYKQKYDLNTFQTAIFWLVNG